MNATIRNAIVVSLVLTCGGCNGRHSLMENVAAPAAPVALSAPQASVYSVGFQPVAMIGQTTILGTLLLTAAAPAGGLNVSLSTGDPSLLSLPSSVTVPPGKDSVSFPGTAQAVTADRDVLVTAASAPGRPVTATVSLWVLLPTFFSFWSQPGDWVGGGQVRRLTPPFDRLSAACVGSSVIFQLWKGSLWWQGTLSAPRGVPLRVGTYEGAVTSPVGSEPGIDIGGEGRGCGGSTGRFIVREATFTASGQVVQFWASFEQRCHASTAGLYGDVRITNGPPSTFSEGCRQ